MSPIHPANQELDFDMKKDERKGPIKSNLPTPVINKESKHKVNITIPIDDSESSGYWFDLLYHIFLAWQTHNGRVDISQAIKVALGYACDIFCLRDYSVRWG